MAFLPLPTRAGLHPSPATNVNSTAREDGHIRKGGLSYANESAEDERRGDDAGGAVDAERLLHTRDQEEQSDAGVVGDVGEGVEAVVVGPVGDG